MKGALRRLIDSSRKGRSACRASTALAIIVAVASVLLLGLSGWFLAGAALAGTAGPLAARLFNYMLPAAAIRLMAIARTGARYGERLTGHAVAFATTTRVRAALYRSIAAMPPVRALAIGRGDAVARIVQDIGTIEGSLVRSASVWAGLAAMVAAIGASIVAGWGAGVLLIALAGVAVTAGHALSRRSARPDGNIQRETGRLKERLLDYADAAAELRCFALTDRAMEEIEAIARRMDRAVSNQAGRSALVDAVLPVAAAGGMIGLLVLSRPAGPAVAALAGLAALAAFGELNGMFRIFAERRTVTQATDRLDEMLLAPGESFAVLTLAARPAIALRGRDATPCGSIIGLVGPSGSGKTTLIETLIGLRPATAGIARIDGIDISLIPPTTLRSVFAWLPQDALLLTGTVRDNLTLACPDGTDAIFWDALEDAMIADRVRAMPRGLDSWIGENGEKFSGGERRRLALARTYCSMAPWLLLDEPFEALDAQTANDVARRLQHRLSRRGQGAVVVSHGQVDGLKVDQRATIGC